MLGGHAPAPETSEWVGTRDDVLYGKLAAVGLVPAREPKPGDATGGVTLAAFIDRAHRGPDDCQAEQNGTISG